MVAVVLREALIHKSPSPPLGYSAEHLPNDKITITDVTTLTLTTGSGTVERRNQKGVDLHLEHLECSHQPHIQGREAKMHPQRAG